MAFDGLTVHAVTQQLDAELMGARITKIYQPSRFDLILHCRRPGGGSQLLISGHPQYARIHTTEVSYSNPLNPPAFCMLMRKHLEGGKITHIRQVGFERIIEIGVESLSDSGQLVQRTLLVEIMGRHSNVVVLDASSGVILDALHRVTDEVSRYRQVLPGETYVSPPQQDKLNPLTTTKEQFLSQVAPSAPQAKVAKVVMQAYQGISPVTGQEIVARAGFPADVTSQEVDGDWDKLWTAFTHVFFQLTEGHVEPTLALDSSGLPVEFAPYSIKTVGVSETVCATISEAIDRYYDFKVNRHQVNQLAGDLNRIISTHLNRLEGKIAKQEETLHKAAQADKYRVLGDLLTANLYRVSQGQKSVTVENFYSADQEAVSIQLDPTISPAANAQKYFKRYNKAKNSMTATTEQLVSSRAEVEYLQGVQSAIELAESVAELGEIREELIAEGYIKEKTSKKRKPKKQAPAAPLQFTSSDGLAIYVGRNNRQNDYLTFTIGTGSDLWLHVKDIPGSHVIVKTAGKEVPDSTLEQAARLAAYYSKARQSSSVAVDYTERKNVRKPNGAKPGKVIYDNYHTILAAPQGNLSTIGHEGR